MHITEKGASELKKIHQEIDIPLSLEAGVNTASIVMKHSLKVRNSTTIMGFTLDFHWRRERRKL